MALTGLYGLSSSVAWRTFMKDPQAQLDKFAKNKDVQKEIDYFRSKSPKFTSVDDLLKDRRALRVLLSAYDLQDELATGMGRIKKVLTEDPTSDGALSARLADSRFAAMAKDLRLDQSLAKLKSGLFFDKVETKYIQSEFEQALGKQDPALREAAYFARNVTSKANNIYNVLGDKVIRNVVQETLNLPPQLAIQSVEAQARAITSKLKINEFTAAIRQSGGMTDSQIKMAQQDASALSSNLKISDAAIKQVTSLQTAINKALTDYDTLANRTITPAEEAAQQAAVPQLLRFEQLLNSGGTAINSVAQNITKLQQLVTDAANPANSSKLADYKASFTTLMTAITSQISGASVKTPTTYDASTNGGTAPTENILQFSGNTVLTARLLSNGTKNVDINVYDGSDLTAALDAAKAAFDNLSGSSDNANLSTATNKLNSALTRTNSIKSGIASDKAKLLDKMDDITYGVPMNSGELLNGQQSISDAITRTNTVAKLLNDISTLAETSAKRPAAADRSDLATKFNALRTQLNNAISTTGAAGLDNLLTVTGQTQYNIMDRPASGGGTEDINLYANGVGGLMQEIMTALDSASLGDAASAKALEIKALQLTTRTDTATKSLNADQPVFTRAINNYDPKAKIDQVFFNLQANLAGTVAAATVGTSNLLSSDQSDISFAVTSNSDIMKLRAAKTFQSDTASQLNAVIAEINTGDLTTIRAAAKSLSNVIDRTTRYLTTDNRALTFEKGRIGAVLDVLQADTDANGNSIYKVNSFTEKFLVRFLTMNGSNGVTFSATQAATLNMFSGSTASAGDLLSLSLSV